MFSIITWRLWIPWTIWPIRHSTRSASSNPRSNSCLVGVHVVIVLSVCLLFFFFVVPSQTTATVQRTECVFLRPVISAPFGAAHQTSVCKRCHAHFCMGLPSRFNDRYWTSLTVHKVSWNSCVPSQLFNCWPLCPHCVTKHSIHFCILANGTQCVGWTVFLRV